MGRYELILIFFVLLIPTLFECRPQDKKSSIELKIGPNVRASDKGVSHVEPYITAHPEDPRNLIIAASHNIEGKGVIAEAFFTTDW